MKIKVLIVDDSKLIRSIFSDILSSDPEIEVVGVAEDPFDARDKIKQLNPDVITLDIEMPKMDGINFLKRIMALRPMPVVMVSTLTKKGADVTIEALEIGAVDYMTKPSASDSNAIAGMKEELIRKVKTAARARVKQPSDTAGMKKLAFAGKTNIDFIAIGASTGGVEAIRDVLMVMPISLPPVVITQHMPEHFTASFAARLDKICNLKVQEARNMQPLNSGNAYIAPGGLHMEVKKAPNNIGYVCHLYDGELVSGHKPSVDALFSSVAKIANKNVLGVILTGMGKDGAKGLLEMRRAGSKTLGQDEKSCVVYGMPKAAKLLDAVEEELPLKDIPKRIVEICTSA